MNIWRFVCEGSREYGSILSPNHYGIDVLDMEQNGHSTREPQGAPDAPLSASKRQFVSRKVRWRGGHCSSDGGGPIKQIGNGQIATEASSNQECRQ